MKFKLAALALALLFSTGANAADIGLITSGQSGTLPNNVVGTWCNNNCTQPVVQIDETYSGKLAAGTSITINFSVTNGTLDPFSSMTLSGSGSYQFDNRVYYPSYTGAYSNGGTTVTLPTSTAPASATGTSWGGVQTANGNYTAEALEISSAHLTDAQHASVTITNISSFLADFSIRLQDEIIATLNNMTLVTTYNATGLSPVPLPASFLLFTSALLIMGFVAYRKRA